MASGQVCSESTFLVPSSRSGYLSSHIALETNRGSQDCPWLIRTDPGRRVVINLIDFGYGETERTNSMSNEYELCTVYAIVRERNTPSGVTVCAGTVRNKTVYTSVSHMVEVQILGRRGSFLLKYEEQSTSHNSQQATTVNKPQQSTSHISQQATSVNKPQQSTSHNSQQATSINKPQQSTSHISQQATSVNKPQQ
ncbi:hypothetical protein LSAT2_014430, partial [Lamellibrachia satsuma]